MDISIGMFYISYIVVCMSIRWEDGGGNKNPLSGGGRRRGSVSTVLFLWLIRLSEDSLHFSWIDSSKIWQIYLMMFAGKFSANFYYFIMNSLDVWSFFWKRPDMHNLCWLTFVKTLKSDFIKMKISLIWWGVRSLLIRVATSSKERPIFFRAIM